MNATPMFTGPLAQALGWALLHLVWQATLVAGILAAVLALMSGRNSNARYLVSCGALVLVFSMFVATAVRSYDPAAAPITPVTSKVSAQTQTIPLTRVPVLLAEGAAQSVRQRAVSALASARNAFPSMVAMWLFGVALLSARLMVSWLRARRLAYRNAVPASAEWQRVAARLSRALRLDRAVTLLQSTAVEVPSVIGSLRPIILLPASALTGLTVEQMEMVLAHELAHIRRHDFLVNLLQAVVETLMFYHPAVWWMSRRVRIERENCCDDMAVAVCGDALRYARALTRLEELRASALPVMVAANGGSLLDRIRRIAIDRSEGTATSSRWAAALVMLVIVGVALVVPSFPALAQREKKTEKKVEASKTTVDVVAKSSSATDQDVDVDVDAPDVDIDVPGPDVDVNVDYDYDYDYDYDSDNDGVPVPPVPVVAAVAPMAGVAAIAPMAPIAPVAAIATVHGAPAMAVVRAGHDDDDDEDVELGAGGKLSVDELISLRAAGVTPAYVNKMRAIFNPLTLRAVTGMAANGVTPEYVAQMRAAGFAVTSAREVTSLKAVGVTPEYIAQMKAAGLNADDAREITSLRAVGVTPEFVKQMREAGFQLKSVRDATNLAAVGVTPEYVAQMRAAGFTIDNAHDASSLRAVDVTPDFVARMRALGFDLKTAKDATNLRAVGVTPEWVKEMRDAGVKIDDVRDATNLRAVDVTPEFVRKLAAAGYPNLTARELSRLAGAGIDEDFIREMQQYRKKN